MASYDVEVQQLHDKVKHIADFKIHKHDFEQAQTGKLASIPKWKFYSAENSALKCEQIMISDLRNVKDYLNNIEQDEKIKIVKNCKDVDDIKHFENRLRFCLGKRNLKK